MNKEYAINDNVISQHYKILDKIGNLGETQDKGFLRAGYFAEELEVIKYFEKNCSELGLSCRFDEIGNFTAETQSQSGKYIEFGSHVDTVPYGGNYDGLAGVVAGFEAIRFHLKNNTALNHGLRLRIWRLEESSAFNASCFGSRAAFGLVDPTALENVFENVKLRDAIIAQGYNPEVIEKRENTILIEELDTILAHFELHIEQANVLEINQTDIGIVTSIRAPKNIKCEIEGAFDHSGGTPYGRPYRRDANLAMAYMHVALDELLQRYIKNGHDVIHTVSVINSNKSINDINPKVYQNAPAKVSGYSYFVVNIRSSDDQLREEYIKEVYSLLAKIAEDFAVQIKLTITNESPAIKEINANNQLALKKACENLNFKHQLMPSGAMHDVAVLGQQKNSLGLKIPIGMIFIPCRQGISHSPEEFATFDAVAKGAKVFAEVVSLLN